MNGFVNPFRELRWTTLTAYGFKKPSMLTALKTMLLAWIKALTPCSHEWEKVQQKEYEVRRAGYANVSSTIVRVGYQCPKCLKTNRTEIHL